MDGTVNISIKDFESFKEIKRKYEELIDELKTRDNVVKTVYTSSYFNGMYNTTRVNTDITTYFISSDTALKELDSHYQSEIAKIKDEFSGKLKFKDETIESSRNEIIKLIKKLDDLSSTLKEKSNKKWFGLF
jgi:hypothetical protein